jgi:hypothetical protein
MLLRMVEKEVAHGSNEEGRGLGDLAAFVGHETTEGTLGFLLLVAAFYELDLFVFLAEVDLGIPPAIIAVKGATCQGKRGPEGFP